MDLGGNGLQQVLQFVIFILLARFLAPDIFGYVALAFVFLDTAGIIGKWGINDILIQRRRVTPALISHAFAFSMSLAVLLSLLIVAGTFVYVGFHGFDIMAQLMLTLVPIVLLQAAEMVPETLVRRRLDFRRLAFRNNSAAITGGVVALVLAYFGMGVYALVVQRFVSLAILLIFVWAAAGREIRLLKRGAYRPALFKRIGFQGWQMVSSPLSTMLGPRLTDLLVGAILGAQALGVLKVAKRIFDFVSQLAISPVASVAQAAFPQLAHDPDELKNTYQKIQGISALAVFPLFAGISVTAPYWVPLFLGRQWMEAVALIQWTSLLAIPAVVNYFQIPLLIALRQNSLIFKQNYIRVILAVAFSAIGVFFGLIAVVQFSLALAYAYMAFNWFMIRKIAGWKIRDSVVNIWPASFATAILIASAFAAEYFMTQNDLWLRMGILSATGLVSYALALGLFFPKMIKATVKDGLALIKRGKTPAPAL